MTVEELTNYGKDFVDIMSDPDLAKRVDRAMSREFRRELGLSGAIRMLWHMRRETERLKGHAWSNAKKRGLHDQKFLDEIIHSTTAMKVLADAMGMDEASATFMGVWDRVAYDVMRPIFPTVDELNACGDAFECMKEWIKVFHAANERSGVYETEMVEDSLDVFAFNFTYCTHHEVAKELGDPYLCYPTSCYPDEVIWPRMGLEAGWRFSRSGTLATGAPVCDFRLERLQPAM
jgi:hypothetical protein